MGLGKYDAFVRREMLKSELEEIEARGEMGISRGIAHFVVKTAYEDLPAEVIEAAKKAFLDCFGVSIAGTQEPTGKLIRNLVKEMEARPVAGVLGGGFRTAPMLAALANGTQAHALDYDDCGTIPLPLHPSVPVFPVALALGEAEKASGKDALLAYILGVEIETKLAASIKVSYFAHGWHPTATLGTLGAAMAAARLLKLKVEQAEAALGIAASLAGGLRQNFGTMTKPLHAGNAAKNGVMAAALAKKGFDAATSILEAPCGFLNVFAGKGEYSSENIVASLGRPFFFAHPGISVKKYPSCRGTHASIEALSELIKSYEIRLSDIENVECAISSLSEGDAHLSRPHARTSLEGKFSIEHCLSVLLLDREVGLRQFSLERVLDPRVEEMRQRVKVYARSDMLGEDEKGEYHVTQVKVKLKNGRQLSHLYRQYRGEGEVPWPWEELIKKFNQCASLTLPSERVERLIEFLRHLDTVEKISQIVDLALVL